MERTPQRTQQREPKNSFDFKDYDDENQFYIDPATIPEGMSYEWKRFTIRGMEDKQYQSKLRQRGYWSPVPASRHPELAGFGVEGDQPIIIEDQILMERPIELTEERKRRNDAKAKRQVSDKMAEMEMGGKTPLKPQSGQNKIKRSMEIPD